MPTYDRDIRQLAHELLAGMAALPQPGLVELLVLIDGNPALLGQEAVVAEAEALGLAAGLAVAPANLGRAEARNALARLARGAVLLFLDADSLPDDAGFVARALAAAREDAVVCGGRSALRLGPCPADARLFDAHCRKREWLPATVRNEDPAPYFLSANFQVGRELFLAHPFDPRFLGWGWEDTEWALRMGRMLPIIHIDNSVTHMEFHRDADWMGRLDRSVGNYQRMLDDHPEAVLRHRIMAPIRALRPISGWGWLQGLLLRVATATALPAGPRLKIAKLRQALVFGAALRLPPG